MSKNRKANAHPNGEDIEEALVHLEKARGVLELVLDRFIEPVAETHALNVVSDLLEKIDTALSGEARG